MTNGEKIQTILDIDQDCTEVYGKKGMMTFSVSQDWWNAEYKEPVIYNDALPPMPYAEPDNCGNYIEQTTMSDLAVDCISREQAIDAFPDLLPNMGYNKKTITEILQELPPVTLQPTKNDLGVEINGLDDFIEFGKKAFGVELTIKALEQEPKKGHWIDEGFYAEGHSEHKFMCSKCEGHYIGYAGDLKWCPHCGSDNSEVEE